MPRTAAPRLHATTPRTPARAACSTPPCKARRDFHRRWPGEANASASDELQQLEVLDRARIEVDALLERTRHPPAAERDDPALLDDQLIDHAAIAQRRAADGGVLAL